MIASISHSSIFELRLPGHQSNDIKLSAPCDTEGKYWDQWKIQPTGTVQHGVQVTLTCKNNGDKRAFLTCDNGDFDELSAGTLECNGKLYVRMCNYRELPVPRGGGSL